MMFVEVLIYQLIVGKLQQFHMIQQVKMNLFVIIISQGQLNIETKLLSLYTGGSQQFGLYFITYQKSGSPAVNVVKSSSINNNKYEITKSNVEKGSIYFDVGDGDYLDRVSIDIFYEEYEDDDDGDYTSSVRTSKSSSGISTGLLVGIIVGGVALIAIVTIGICVYMNYRKKQKMKLSNTVNYTSQQNPNMLM